MRNRLEREQLYLRAIVAWGAEAQDNMLTEEVGELLQARNKLRRAREADKAARTKAFEDELADVAIMLEQAYVLHFGALDGLRRAKEQKLNRLAQRLEVPHE